MCYKISHNKFYIADPSSGLVTYTKEEFEHSWINTKVNGQDTGVALLLEPEPKFYNTEDDTEENKWNIRFFFRYLSPYKEEMAQLVLGCLPPASCN